MFDRLGYEYVKVKNIEKRKFKLSKILFLSYFSHIFLKEIEMKTSALIFSLKFWLLFLLYLA